MRRDLQRKQSASIVNPTMPGPQDTVNRLSGMLPKAQPLVAASTPQEVRSKGAPQTFPTEDMISRLNRMWGHSDVESMKLRTKVYDEAEQSRARAAEKAQVPSAVPMDGLPGGPIIPAVD